MGFPILRKILSTPVEKLFPRGSVWPPLACFGALVLSNTLLAYADLPFLWKILVVVLGLLLPWGIAFSLLRSKNSREDRGTFPVPVGLWCLLWAAAFFLRFYRLTSLSSWPIMDEGMFGYFALRLYEHWNWELTHWVSQEPILYTWGLAWCFKLWGPSLFSLWFFPAACSFLCLPMAWWASRTPAPLSGRFLFTALLALGFWPLYLGRFSVQSVLVVLLELWSFGLLGRYLVEKDLKTKLAKTLVLGVSVGVGFYSYLAWPLVALFVLLVLVTDPSLSLPRRLKAAGLYFATAALLALPLLLAYSREYRGYFGHLGASGLLSDGLNRLPLSWTYFRDLFWGDPGGFFRYGPVWGGLFDPVSTTLLFLGLARLAARPSRWTLWAALGMFLFFLPALLTNDLELMRLTPLIPVLTGIAAWGGRSLSSFLPPGRAGFLALVLAAIGGLSAYQLLGVYPRLWERDPDYYGAHKSEEFHGAYPLLESLAKKEGPGWILLHFNPDPYDQTLYLATYGFNAAENPRLDPLSAKWAAFLVNAHEQPYLAGALPQGRWVWLSEGLHRRDGGFLLGMVPLDDADLAVLNRWREADGALSELDHMVMERDVDPDQNPMLEVLRRAYPSFRDDPLLESRYWRIVALHHAAGGDTTSAVSDEFKAIRRGLPLAPLYNELGCLLFQEGDGAGARRAFQSALAARPNLTNASQNLANLPPPRPGRP